MVLTFCLPFCLHLPDDRYKIRLSQNDQVILELKKIIPRSFDERMGSRGLVKGDLRNVFRVRIFSPVDGDSIEIGVKDIWNITQMREVTYFLTKNRQKIIPMDRGDKKRIFINTEISNDRLGRFRYTRVRFYSNNADNEKSRAVDAINRLIDYYRTITDSYAVHRLTDQDIMIFETRNHGVSSTESTKGLSQFRADIETSIVNQLKKFLVNDTPIEPYYLLRIEAKKAFHEGNYFLSAVLSGTAVEALIKYYLIIKPEYISKSKIKKIAYDFTFGSLLKELRAQFQNNLSINGLLTDLGIVYRGRNDVIHNYNLKTTKEEAIRMMNILNRAIKILG